ncbi:MAG: GMC family oxidoreductase [Thermoanaerobaculia bacterium]
MKLMPDRPIRGLLRGADIRSDLALSCEVCVVGSGPGGSVVAARLADRGVDVILLEEGGYHVRTEFDQQEATAFPALYQEHGNRATDDLSIAILQGRGVGGGTLVNWTTSFRTPETTLEHWRREFGLAEMTTANLNPHWEEIEKRLNIHEVTLDEVNENNRVLWDGGRKLGIGVELLKRNVESCLQTGSCGLGCPSNAKRSMFLTYLPDAAEKGARVLANCRVSRLVKSAAGDRSRIATAEAEVLDESTDRPTGRRVVVTAKHFVVAGGAINSAALLLRSQLPDPHERLGKRLFLHPVVATTATFARRIDPFYGAPQSVASHHFIERPGRVGFFLEAPPLRPMLAAIALSGFGGDHREGMTRLSHTNALIALHRDGFLPDDEGGTVRVKGDGGRRLSIGYPLSPALFEAMRESMKAMARIQFAAGATEVQTGHLPRLALKSEREISRIDDAPLGPNRIGLFTAHQMGGCAAGSDPKRSVVSGELVHHQVENLRVIDGSVFPTSLGVNPQESVMGLASWAAQKLLHAFRGA